MWIGVSGLTISQEKEENGVLNGILKCEYINIWTLVQTEKRGIEEEGLQCDTEL